MKKCKISLLVVLFLIFTSSSFPAAVSATEGNITIAGTLSPTETTSRSSDSEDSTIINSFSTDEIIQETHQDGKLPQLGEYSIISLICLICGIALLVIVLSFILRKKRHF